MSDSINEGLARFVLRDDPREIDQIYAINCAHTPEVGDVPREKIEHFARIAADFRVIEVAAEVTAFCITLTPEADYDSPNFLWFRERYQQFLYVDRIAVARSHKRRGYGRRLYQAAFQHAESQGLPRVVCEVNLEPRNDTSLEFHAALGFKEVGRAQAKGHLVAYQERTIAEQT